MDARGLSREILIDKGERSTMAEMAELTETADKVLIF